MNLLKETEVNSGLQEDRHLKSLTGYAHHKSSCQDNSLLYNRVGRNLKVDIHQSDHHGQNVLSPPNHQEVVKLMIVAATKDPGANQESVISQEADLHVIVTGNLLEASHVIDTRNPEVDHVSHAEGLDHVSVLGGGVGRHVTETEEAGRVISTGGVDHVIASDEVDHVKDTDETETRTEAVDIIERKILIQIISIMKAVNQMSKLYDKNLATMCRYFVIYRVADYELESEEDEDTLIERRRQKRLAIVAKYSGVSSQVRFVDDHVILVVVVVTSVRCIW